MTLPPPRKMRCRRAALSTLLILPAGLCAAAPAQDPPMASPLPVRDGVLFSSGVGYYQHAGEINGSTTLPFSFRTEQINDLLKSLVLFDPAGQVRPVTYTAHEPLARGLSGLGVDLNGAQSLGAILRQFQGAQVRVTTASGDVEGRIVSVSAQLVTTDKTTVTVDLLNLLTPGGLTTIPLPEVRQVKLLDEKLDARFRDALSLLATGLDRTRKNVNVNFGGDRRREVRMGYLLESPVWKTSYRLVLGDAGEKKAPYLQGWAIVENMTDEDWNGVRLSLVSGRPVSFIQDLYTPLYVPRPVVRPQVAGSPTPQLHAGALADEENMVALQTDAMSAASEAPAPPAAPDTAGGGFGARSAFGNREEMRKSAMARRRDMAATVNGLAQSIASGASGEERGELFEYAIAQPVSIPRRQAAMVPLVGSDVGGEKLSIYNPQVNPTTPMNAVRLKNTSGLHLSGGPITVFDRGVYAGDGQIENLQPDEERLISYALDLAVEGKYETKSQPQQFLTVRADSGVLHVTRKQRIEHLYTFRNKDDEPRVVLIEQPQNPDWTLVTPAKADETTQNLYRFRVTVPAKATGTFAAVTEQPLYETIGLADADLNYLLGWAQNAQLSEKLRAALGQIVELRRRITNLQQRRAQAENEIKAIDAEQARIRENMKTLDRNSPLYTQYVRKLTEQESRIDALRAEINRLQAAENDARADLRKFLDTLKIE